MIDFEKYRERDLSINLTRAWTEETELDLTKYEVHEVMAATDYIARVEVNFPIKSRQVAASILATADTVLIIAHGERRKALGISG